MEVASAWISLGLGVTARVFVPWLSKRREDPEGPTSSWDWKYVWPQLLSVTLIFLLLPLLVSDLEDVGGLPWQAAWLVGWAAADLGRETYKALAKEE